jgi:thiosulfate sulfurtransferase
MTDKPVLIKCIHLQEAQELINNPGTVIIDIRDKASYQDGNIPNSINVSEENIVDFLSSTDRQSPLLIYC